MIAMLSWPIASAGMLRVNVDEADGPNLNIFIPGILVNLAVHLVPDRVFDDIRREMGEETAKWWPAIEEACRHLENCPDAHLVDVETANETVLVLKRGRNLLINVDSGNERVRVALPVKVMGSVIRKLGPQD
ncbi:MAG: hypothetical protein GY835_20460 [bacterium]|nr:hypothetical protein [bacterium]